jgi:signal transduction histidine kinase
VEQQRTADPHHHFRLDVEAPAALRDLEGYWDSRRIEQILMNLLSNAVKYSPAGTEVRVRVSVLPEGYIPAQRQASRPRRVAGPAALVAISDEGIGMAEDALTRLFDRFYRAPNATGIPGTGLGLYICRQLAWAHQGDLWAESAGIERGSTFRLVLPLTGA